MISRGWNSEREARARRAYDADRLTGITGATGTRSIRLESLRENENRDIAGKKKATLFRGRRAR